MHLSIVFVAFLSLIKCIAALPLIPFPIISGHEVRLPYRMLPICGIDMAKGGIKDDYLVGDSDIKVHIETKSIVIGILYSEQLENGQQPYYFTRPSSIAHPYYHTCKVNGDGPRHPKSALQDKYTSSRTIPKRHRSGKLHLRYPPIRPVRTSSKYQ